MLAPKQSLRTSLYRRVGKRWGDFVLALLLVIGLTPLIMITAFFVRLKLGTPVLFCQQRAGQNGRIFWLFKFRSMLDVTDKAGRPLPDEKRLTRFGQAIRRLSLDELPQLWNVIRGDMSLVGPRPLLVDYLPRYDIHQARRHEVRPGITGLAQVRGRNSLSWPAKFDLDVEYVDRLSLALDLRILLKTSLRILLPRGISADGHATMVEFLGNGDHQPAVPMPDESDNLASQP